MKKNDKSRIIIIKGVAMHLKGAPLKKINDFYNLNFEKYSFDQKDIAFVNYFTNICIRNRGPIETILNQYIKRKLSKAAMPAKAAIMFGIAQIVFSKIPSYAAVNSTVNLFVGNIYRWRKLANAVLRKITKDEKKLKEIEKNLSIFVPTWIYKEWIKRFGSKNTLKMLKIYKKEPSLDIRVKRNLNFWVEELGGIKLGKSTVRLMHKGKIANLKGYKEGKWWIQDFAAQIPVILMGDIRGKRILDLCASPGGKTAQMLSEGAIVTALDISKERIQLLSKNIQRVGLSKNLKLVEDDLLAYEPQSKSDIVLLDAPCTGTGTFRKNPDVVWIKNKTDVKENANYQKKLIIQALNFLKKDGFLIYSNCSLQYEEGEDIIKDLSNQKLIYVDKISNSELLDYPKEIINKGLIRTLPFMYTDGMDGFFVARIKKAI